MIKEFILVFFPEDTVPGGFKRTIILMHFSPTSEEEQLFIRGGYSGKLAYN